VDASDALNAADAVALSEGGNDERLFFDWKDVCHRISFVWTICATETKVRQYIFVAQKEKSSKSGKTGRPKLPTGAAKSKTIRTRFSPEEHGRIEKAAARGCESISDWVRKVLLDAAGDDIVPQ
jgi:hypothetical protein